VRLLAFFLLLLNTSLSLLAQSNFQYELSSSKGFKDSRNSTVEDSSNYPPLLKLKNSKSLFTVHPILEYLYGSDNLDGNIQRWGIGSQLNYRSKRVDAGFTFLYSQGEFMRYQRDFIDRAGVIPAYGDFSSGGEIVKSRFWDAYFNYKPADFFEAELGYGRKFIGNGHRSLLNSDFTSPYPYLKLQTSFWKLTYTNLFALQTNNFQDLGNFGRGGEKFTATHFLELQLSKKLRLGVFETVVWQTDEGSYYRGVDPNYLNPVIFYRPVEFSVGSSDNVLIGLNLSYEPTEAHQFYFQALLDEFLLKEMRADLNQRLNPDQDIQSGWWGNKYGIQIGWKGQDLLGIENLSSRLEFNLCRPYTYAHTSPTQAYTHNNLALAHPLGANFQEGIAQLNYQWDMWRLSAQYNNSLQGLSLDLLTNVGDNPELSNTTRIGEYENFIGQGLAVRSQSFQGYVSRRVQQLWGAELSLGYVWRQSNSDQFTAVNNMVYVGLKTNLIRQTFDY